MRVRHLAEDGATGGAAPAMDAAVVAATVPRWKRVLDIAVGVVALVVLAPIMAASALLIAASGPGGILFRQTRVGLNGEPFTIFKFRTMRGDASDDLALRAAICDELAGVARPDPTNALFRPARDGRITPVGGVLRRLSIDELPQLFNVLKGEMSLVGPRPALPWETELFTARQRQRNATPPGMTGLWQVSGRNAVNSRDMLALDLRYVRERSLFLDLRILARTPAAVLSMNTR